MTSKLVGYAEFAFPPATLGLRLKRPKMLDLRHGMSTDVGARALAPCPDTKNLQLLDVPRNELTAVGIAVLNGLGVLVQTEHRHGSTVGLDPDDEVCRTDLLEGDYE